MIRHIAFGARDTSGAVGAKWAEHEPAALNISCRVEPHRARKARRISSVVPFTLDHTPREYVRRVQRGEGRGAAEGLQAAGLRLRQKAFLSDMVFLKQSILQSTASTAFLIHALPLPPVSSNAEQIVFCKRAFYQKTITDKNRPRRGICPQRQIPGTACRFVLSARQTIDVRIPCRESGLSPCPRAFPRAPRRCARP